MSTLEDLAGLIDQKSWQKATALAQTLALPPSYVAKHHFLALSSPSSTQVATLLSTVLTDDPAWVIKAAFTLARKTQSVAVLESAVDVGTRASAELVDVDDADADEKERATAEQIRSLLVDMRAKGQTWKAVWGTDEVEPAAESEEPAGTDEEHDEEGWGLGDGAEEEEEHGWDELASPSEVAQTTDDDPTHPSLQHFLRTPLPELALALSATASLDALKTFIRLNPAELWDSRKELLDNLPEWVDAGDVVELLPAVQADGTEKPWAEGGSGLRTGEELTKYYRAKIEELGEAGLVAGALSLVQHGASLGVQGLDELGEELSLLSKLVYDRTSPHPVASTSQHPSDSLADDFTLAHWRSLSPSAIISAYLSLSTPQSLPSDIRRLVLPYLSVLESRLERAGTPDPALPSTLLNAYILSLSQSTHLEHLVAVFDASKPTLSKGARLIKDDEHLARLALAITYGSTRTDGDLLVAFGKIFECLPAFDVANLPAEQTPKTLFESLPTPTTPSSLFEHLASFSPVSLSLSLDALDIHLTSAETFSRYSTPVQLSWLLTSHSDAKAQRAWATRLARTSASGGGGRQGDENEFESEDEWEGLLEDMLALREGEEERVELRKPFWMLGKEEIYKIFFGGLLASGKFGLAKALFRPSSGTAPLDPKVEEELVIAASREFYDNADNGNLHKGEMKLAFDCLSAAPQTVEIKKERDFIEATSRLCSFKIYSRPGIPVAPIEIRLSKDRLSFVSRLLASNEDSYRHPDVVLDLVAKLGYRGDKLAEIRSLAMIADSGLQAGDFGRAADVCDRMVEAVETLRKVHSRDTSPNAVVGDAADVAWQSCFQLGRHDDWSDLERRMRLLGQALVLCPGDKIPTLLPVWTKLEDQVVERRKNKVVEETTSFVPPSLGETAAAASRTFNRAAAFFGGSDRPRDSSPFPEENQERHAPQSATKAPHKEEGFSLGAAVSSRFGAGVGWLIGADEEREREERERGF